MTNEEFRKHIDDTNDRVMELSMETRNKFAHWTRLMALMLECREAPMDELIERMESFRDGLDREIEFQKDCYDVLKVGNTMLQNSEENN